MLARLRLTWLTRIAKACAHATGHRLMPASTLDTLRKAENDLHGILLCSGSINDGTDHPHRVGLHARRKLRSANKDFFRVIVETEHANY